MVSLTSGRVKNCKDSIGGVSKVYLFPFVSYARSLIVYSDLVLSSFPDTNIYEFEVSNNPIFRNGPQENDGGKYYTEDLNLEFVGIELYDEFEKFLEQDFRAIILDRNGIYRLLGAFNGLVCENIEKTTGDNKSSFRGYKLAFTGQEERPALFLNDLNLFTVIENNFLATENGDFILTEDNKLILI